MPGVTASPIPALTRGLDAPVALSPDQCPSLLAHLTQLADPRARRGRRHPLVSVLAIAVAAVLTGARSLAAIGEWAQDAPQAVLAALGGATIRCVGPIGHPMRRPCAVIPR